MIVNNALTIAFTRTAKSVTPFAAAKAAPLLSAGDAGRYTANIA